MVQSQYDLGNQNTVLVMALCEVSSAISRKETTSIVGWKHTATTAGLLDERSMGGFNILPLVCLGDPVHIRLFARHLLHE